MINNSYINEKTCVIPDNFRKRQLSHILENAPTHTTEKNEKKGFAQKNINTNNTSIVGQIVKSANERVARISWEHGFSKIITLCMLYSKWQDIIKLAEFSFRFSVNLVL